MNFVSLKKYMQCSPNQDLDNNNDDSENIANVTPGSIIHDAEIDPVESIMKMFEDTEKSNYVIKSCPEHT